MTISNTASKATYTGNGAQQVFDVKSGSEGIFFETAQELVVALNGAVQTLGVHYTVSGVGTDAGQVTFLTAPAAGVSVTITRVTPVTQTISLSAGSGFNPTVVMGALDKLTRVGQELTRKIADGVDIAIVVGSVTTGDPGSSASVTIVESPADTFTLNFTIPRGDTGAAGSPGAGTGDMLAANNLTDLASPKTGYDNISKKGADIASAATINLDTATGNLVDVTGTTTITAVTLSEGRERTIRFTGVLTFTNGASLVLPGGANITTAAGDYAVLRGYAAGVVRCVVYERASGAPLVLADSSVTTAKIADDAVTYAKLQNISATSRVVGRKTAGAGDPEECTLSELLDFIGSAAQGDILYRGASSWARLGAGTSGHFLKTNGAGANPAWAAATTTGVVTDVRLGTLAEGSANAENASYTADAPAGNVLTGVRKAVVACCSDNNYIRYKPLQKQLDGGSYVTVSG